LPGQVLPELPPLVPPGQAAAPRGPLAGPPGPRPRWQAASGFTGGMRPRVVSPGLQPRPLGPVGPAGPAAGYFVLQDVHGIWPVTTSEPPLPAGPLPLFRASSHPLLPVDPIQPITYTTCDVAPETDTPAARPEKMVIVQTKSTTEIAWGAQEEYRQIVGQLVRVHVHGGRWVVRFAGLDKEDRYGGSVVLDPDADLSQLAEGDVVRVRGEILNGGRAERPLGAPLYRVQSIERLGGGQN